MKGFAKSEASGRWTKVFWDQRAHFNFLRRRRRCPAGLQSEGSFWLRKMVVWHPLFFSAASCCETSSMCTRRAVLRSPGGNFRCRVITLGYIFEPERTHRFPFTPSLSTPHWPRGAYMCEAAGVLVCVFLPLSPGNFFQSVR